LLQGEQTRIKAEMAFQFHIPAPQKKGVSDAQEALLIGSIGLSSQQVSALTNPAFYPN
jgi:hypothetical protein